METKASLRGVHLSAQKGRLIADMIRGKKVDQALDILSFTPKKGAVIIKQVLESAIANAEHNDGADIDELKVSSIYVEKGTSVLAEAETYGEQGRESMSSLENASLIYDDSKVVFYSYPNDWFDESLLNENGTFSDEDIYAIDDLIDEEKQTYILLEAPYGDDSYYYKVPVNFAISKDNDKVSFSKEDIEDLRNNYYRMLRNHIYDITVTIDREGGITEDEAVKPVLQYEVMGYDETEIDVPAFT